ncbi:Protein ZGRF1 [Colletotrichum shisoi]|uniref:Protein ZGRF1 n=1 Tax=Colletotrichum shisoi TaxID=2078593 RepID=A0A5Q4BXV0_9PEZI|nr:Protein ZGRF1 [Colletotrichum shisoi]
MPLTSHNNEHNPPNFGLPIAAPVLEYICLFTHDLKRKQKRWQDGRLKFHTFNKRIMVYDEKGNFIGDMHWREDMDFGEGEELNLERGAVIVQVAECVGSKDQDLTALLDKRARELEQRHARSSAAAADSPLPTTRLSAVSQNHPPAQFRQRHLADVFNTPQARDEDSDDADEPAGDSNGGALRGETTYNERCFARL